MANIKITELNETLTKTNNDVLPIVDITANETKKIKIENLLDKNIELLAVSDTAPSECNIGDKYYNTSTKLIYTATAQDTWSDTGTTPLNGILYIVYADQASYSWDGTDLVSVGGGKEDIVIDDEEPTDPDVKLWIDTGEVGSQASEITNEYSTSIGLGYSANYINGDVLYYDDNKVGTNTQIALQQDISSYRYLEIYFKRTNETITGAGYNYNKIYNNGNNTVLSLSTRYVDTNKYFNSSSTYSINWTNGTITPVRQFNTTITISSSTISYDSANNDIYITRVIGHR